MSSFTGEAAGAERLSGTLGAAADLLDDLTNPARAAGQVALAKAEIPQDTGYLASTAAVTAARDGFALVATAPYAAKVHAGNPFFARAIDQTVDQTVAQVAEHVQHALATVHGA